MGRTDYAVMAAETLKDAVFTCIIKADDIEMWKCRIPGHGIHNALDFVITNMGMTVMGDYDAVTFRVGKQYGLPFLARNVDGYYMEKLESVHRQEREYSSEKATKEFQHFCLYWLENFNIPAPDGADTEDLIREFAESVEEGGMLQMDETERQKAYDQSLEIISFSNDIPGFETAQDFHRGMSDLSFFSGDYCNVEEPTSSLINRLNLISYSAKQILKIKETE